MNTAYVLAIVWGGLAFLSMLFIKNNNAVLVWLLATASVVASLLGVAISYSLL